MNYESALARRLVPYKAGEQPKNLHLIKLNTNEHPYGCSPRVQEAILEETGNLRLYPDMECTQLREAIAEVLGVTPEQVFCGNGSDEVLAFAFAGFFAGKSVYAPEITYSFYPVYASLFGAHYVTLPMLPDYGINLSALSDHGPVVLANPNAPTSMAVPVDALEEVAVKLWHMGEILLIDEAYAAFSDETALRLLRYDNVLIVRTFSKSHGLAGLRVGFALGHPNLIQTLRKVRDSFNSYPVDRLAQAGARAAILDDAWMRETVRHICDTRNRCRALWTVHGLDVRQSHTNFLFLRADATDAGKVQAQLRNDGILVRHFGSPRLRPYLRITVGTDPDMDIVNQRLLQYLCGTANQAQ